MDLINQPVIYKPLIGKTKEGKVIMQEDNKIYIDVNDKPLAFPNAFEKILRLKDKKLQAEIEQLIADNKANKANKEREEREAKFRAIEEAKRIEAERIAAQKHKNTPDRHANENNLAFKCNYCNGGCSDNCLGYKGVCSDEQINKNIKDGRAWCSKPSSPCYKYNQGIISRQELDDLNISGAFVCYEARMLLDWKAEAGEDVDDNGVHKGRRISNASTNSLAVLTTTLPSRSAKERIIFGVFITGIVDEGDDFNTGYVKVQGDYRIELTPNEAKQLKFENYYKNSDGGTRWGQGLYRYLKDSVCVQILKDIVDIKQDINEKEHAKRVLEYYCRIKGIRIEDSSV